MTSRYEGAASLYGVPCDFERRVADFAQARIVAWKQQKSGVPRPQADESAPSEALAESDA